ncbi:MAG: prephenate dehydratase [Candidatus Saganbacteria bacterium]|nr:prephenate dehydratase [Candidatus Saganbacteria bacterium]
MKKKVGYLGPEGTFSEEASVIYSKYVKNVEFFPCGTIHDLLRDVDAGKLDEGIVPIENSIEGTVGVVSDMLAKDVNLKICQELNLPIFDYLLAPPGVKIRDITDVISHPQPIEQSKDFLMKNLPKAELHLAYSTADAARQVAYSLGKVLAMKKAHKDGEHLFAAIGSLAAARLYKLEVLAEKINAQDNATRFVVLAKEDHKRTGQDKTSIVFSILKDRPGGLYDILGEFAKRKTNLTKIESRPSKKKLGDYLFFIDMEGHREDPDIAEALSRIKKKASFFKFLGSYPMAKMPIFKGK